MYIEITEIPARSDAKNVVVGGKVIGTIVYLRPDCWWTDLDGQSRMGRRWIPAYAPGNLPGPRTAREAAAVLLIDAGFKASAVMAALHLPRERSTARRPHPVA